MAQERETVQTLPRVAAVGGSLLVGVSLVLIWAAKASTDRSLYVSGLGADGEPTAGRFELALLLLVAGGYAIAWALRGTGSAAAGLLGRWSPSVSLAISSSFFLVASQVPCTYGCPVPVGDTFTWQDFTHVVTAVAGFAFAAYAMIQVSLADTRPALRRLSRTSGVLVAVVAAAGGMSSLLGFRTDIGSMLEFVATSIAIGWLALTGLVTAAARPVDRPVEDAERKDLACAGTR